MEPDRLSIKQEKELINDYNKKLLVKQNDIIKALTARLNERDKKIMDL